MSFRFWLGKAAAPDFCKRRMKQREIGEARLEIWVALQEVAPIYAKLGLQAFPLLPLQRSPLIQALWRPDRF